MNQPETRNLALRRTGVFPAVGQPMRTELWWLAIGYRAMFTVLGGWVSARGTLNFRTHNR